MSQLPSFTNNLINNPSDQILLERLGKKLFTVLIDLSLSMVQSTRKIHGIINKIR